MTKRNKMARVPSFFVGWRTQKADVNYIKSKYKMKGNKRYGNMY